MNPIKRILRAVLIMIALLSGIVIVPFFWIVNKDESLKEGVYLYLGFIIDFFQIGK